MEKYTINGVEIAYDTFDIDNLEAFEEEVQRVADECGLEQEGESGLHKVRRICNAMRDFFNEMCGDGTARKIFGERTNVQAIYDGYRTFTAEVNQAVNAYTAQMKEPVPTNRAQRRTAEHRK